MLGGKGYTRKQNKILMESTQIIKINGHEFQYNIKKIASGIGHNLKNKY